MPAKYGNAGRAALPRGRGVHGTALRGFWRFGIFKLFPPSGGLAEDGRKMSSAEKWACADFPAPPYSRLSVLMALIGHSLDEHYS
jgi:hypothetical protein